MIEQVEQNPTMMHDSTRKNAHSILVWLSVVHAVRSSPVDMIGNISP